MVMFKAALKSDILKNMVNAISPVSDEVKFSITPEGMAMRAVDPTHIEMIGLDINKAAFDSFEADETEIGLELDKVRDVLKLASSGDVVTIEQDSERGKLIFKLGNITRRMNLLDTSSINAPKVPNLELSATIVAASQEILKGIKASFDISDHISLSAEGETFELASSGDTDSMSLVMDKSSLVSINAPTAVRSAFTIDYFFNIIRAVPSDTNVTIGLDTDKPVKISYGLAEGNGVVRYLLAPRIED